MALPSHVSACCVLLGLGLLTAVSCHTRPRSPAESEPDTQPAKALTKSALPETLTPPQLRSRDRRLSAWLEELANEATANDLERPDPSVDPWAHAHTTTPEFCRRITGHERPFESCRLFPAALGTAGYLAIVEDCGAHLCDVQYWVFARDDLTWVSEMTYGGLDLEVSADHRWLLISQLVPTDDLPDGGLPPMGPRGPMWTYELVTEFIDLETQRRAFDVPCGSMVISPERRYYVCRDIAGHVLRIPTGAPGKIAPERIVTIALSENESLSIGGSFQDYPSAVRFPTKTTLEYDLFLDSGELITRSAPWSE